MFQDLSLTTLEISLFGVCTLNRSQCKLCSITTVPFDKMLHYYNGVPSHQTLTDLTRNSLYNFEHFLKKYIAHWNVIPIYLLRIVQKAYTSLLFC